MNLISKDTATDIAMAYREVEVAERLLADVREAADRFQPTDIRDAFGRAVHGLQLGVPNGRDSTRLFNVPYSLAVPIIEAHIAEHRARISALTLKAKAEIAQQPVACEKSRHSPDAGSGGAA